MANVEAAMCFFKEQNRVFGPPWASEAIRDQDTLFYSAQKRRLTNALVDLDKHFGLMANDLADVVHSSDSFQGQEADTIILDTTVCNYTGGVRWVKLATS
jgi:hypothetical protein